MTSELFDILTRFGDRVDRVTHVEQLPARLGRTTDWPSWMDPAVRDAFVSAGIERPYEHQVETADIARAGENVIVATGTASGKSLGYLMPVLDAAIRGTAAPSGRGSTTLYLSPTKALAADQLTSLRELVLKGLRPSTYDGDTPRADRDWARRHANLILTNPDMLHRSLLPGHERFSSVLKRLDYVVVDEAHRYRGVFGSHVALILRRLLRLARYYGASPVVIGASATAGDPADVFSRLIGSPARAVVDDASPRAAGRFLLWEPPLLPGLDPREQSGPGEQTGPFGQSDPFGQPEDPPDPWADSAPHDRFQQDPAPEAPVGRISEARRSSLAEAADLLTDTTCAGRRAIGFIASRRGAEALASIVKDEVARVDDSLVRTIAAYRGGYLPEERRLLETALRSGRLLTVASTNALELGIDISGLDAVIIAGWPGTLASLWQQAGRAGRSGQEWIAVLVARDDPLDTYLVHHPEAVFGKAVDAVVIDPGNPYVLAGHLCAAAAEVPFTDDDFAHFPESAPSIVDQLTSARMLRRRPGGWFWAKAENPADLSDIRSGGGGTIRLVERETGALLGTVDDAGSHHQSHPGAVYVHQGRTFVVVDLDPDERVALVEQRHVDYTTESQSVTEIGILGTRATVPLPSGAAVSWGEVEVTSQVTGYRMRQSGSGTVLGEYPLELPSQVLRTTAVWWTAPDALIDEADVTTGDLPGAVHAAEHAAIGLLPLFAGCDRWDIGGVSTARHADTGVATVFVHDGQPGGAGFAERGFEAFSAWQTATREAIEACECVSGCPSCVQSPKCGNGNEPLEKDAAARLLRVVLG
ncbi:DEAD/DEAH box helicase [Brevibacterium yomogidense]|uniref:Putative helicase n=1 Tax=Brevibacterium yomogidense TaxID=946573 RepID=A0A1X6XE73_9MICO|nr:DEAD/DEAH box helicase [Brevibacterium yomogidense]SLM97436.1 putative helicase [Brevibacterium yomogidense]